MRLPHELSSANPEGLEARMLYWVAQGWAVFPLAPRSKEPLAGSRGVKDATRDPATIARWAADHPDANIGGSCANKLVIDVDPRSGGQVPEDLPPTRRHYSGRGDGGVHLIYTLTDQQRVKSGSGVLGEGVDVKTGANSYVVLPGSIHPYTGQPYTADNQPMVWATDELVGRIAKSKGGVEGGADVRSMFTSLWDHPPAEGGRNEWLAKVCGHLAKRYRVEPDIYWSLVRTANERLTPPLDAAEVDKTAQSIWNTESSGHPERDFLETLEERAGWLVSGDYQILTAGYEGDDKKTAPVAVQFADFDLKLTGILRDPEDNSLTYDLLLQLQRDKTEIPISLEADLFGDGRALRRRLASFGASITQPDKLVHKTPEWTTKLHQYVQNQHAPTAIQADRLGWCEPEQGFLTFDGVIDESGPRGYSVARPAPALKASRMATQRYGTAASAQRAREILGEVCTFQEDETVAIFGAWWAANFAKHIVRRHTPLFPVMAIEAASGSGKTSGFFSLMVQLSGATSGEGHYTIPTLRNTLAGNYNGVVWVDDLDEPQSIHELIRVLTAGGTLTKMVNQSVTTNYQLVGSLVMSGESLGLEDQKATRDRCVILSPDSPVDRRSTKGDYPQWNDIVDIVDELESLGGGASLAGHYVIAVLAAQERINRACVQLRMQAPSGRDGSRWLILEIGARILDYLTTGETERIEDGSGRFAQTIAAIHAQGDPVDDAGNVRKPIINDNTLTQKILPQFLAERDLNPDNRSPIASMYEHEGQYTVLLNARALAEWWRQRNNGKIQIRTESENGINRQLAALKKAYPDDYANCRQRVGKGTGSSPKRFVELNGDLAREIVLRAQD